MSLEAQMIAPFKTGITTDLEPWIAPPDSFSRAVNVHVHHGYLEKRGGFSIFGQLIPNATPISINDITQANPGEVTTVAAHGFSTGDFVFITGVTGMTEVNDKGFTITVTAPTTFTINQDTTSFSAYAGGGTVALVDSSIDRVMGLFRFIDSSGGKELLAFTTQRASLYNNATNTFDQLDAANIMSGSDSDFIWGVNWQSTALDNRLYFTNGKAFDGATLDGIRHYDGNGSTTTSFVPELTPSGTAVGSRRFLYGGKLLFVLKQRLIVLNTFERDETTATTDNFPQRVRWCQAQGPSNWDDITPGGGGFVDCPTGGHIVSARALQNQIIVFFTDSVWTLQVISDPALPFVWKKINDFRACEGKMASVGYDRDVRALGVRGITSTDGVETRRIDTRIEDFVVDEINIEEFDKVFCGRDYAARRWWTLYPAVDSSENNAALIFDDESSAFTTYEIDLNVLGYGNFGIDLRFNDFTAANERDYSFNDMGEETFESFFWQDTEEELIGGNINGTVLVLDNTNDDDNTQISAEVFSAGWNPYKSQGFEAQMNYVDFFVDTSATTFATVEFYKDNDVVPYVTQEIDFLPNLGFIASILNITAADPASINAPSHGLTNADVIFIYGVRGMVQINGGPYSVTVVDENNFTLDGVDSTAFGAFTFGGVVVQRAFYKTQVWKRAYGGGYGYEHRIRLVNSGLDQPFRFHAFKPAFRPRKGRMIN